MDDGGGFRMLVHKGVEFERTIEIPKPTDGDPCGAACLGSF